MEQDTSLVWIRIFYSLFTSLLIAELLEWRVTKKSSLKIKAFAIGLGWALVEIVLELENYFLVEVNNRINYKVVGIEEYAFWFFLTVAIIEETVKFIAIGISIRFLGHEKMYPAVGVAGAFAGWETYIYIKNAWTFDQAKVLVDFRLEAGSMTVHLLMVFMMLSVVMVMHEKEWYLKWSAYIGVYVVAIIIHLYFNYWTMLQLFNLAEKGLAKNFIWTLGVLGFILWAFLYGRLVKYDKFKDIKEKLEKMDEPIKATSVKNK